MIDIKIWHQSILSKQQLLFTVIYAAYTIYRQCKPAYGRFLIYLKNYVIVFIFDNLG